MFSSYVKVRLCGSFSGADGHFTCMFLKTNFNLKCYFQFHAIYLVTEQFMQENHSDILFVLQYQYGNYELPLNIFLNRMKSYFHACHRSQNCLKIRALLCECTGECGLQITNVNFYLIQERKIACVLCSFGMNDLYTLNKFISDISCVMFQECRFAKRIHFF